jgi:hypothetical protein
MLKRTALLVAAAAFGFAAAASDAMASPKGHKHFGATNFRASLGGLPSGTNTHVPSSTQPRFTGRGVQQPYKARGSIVNGYAAEFYAGGRN